LKILHVIANLSPEKGGPSKVIIEMCEALVKEGHDVSIYTTDEFILRERKDNLIDFPIITRGIKIFYFPFFRKIPWYYSPKMGNFIKNTIINFDVVHIHSLYLYHTMITAYYCRKNSIPYIIRPHGTLDPFIRKNGKLKKFFYHKLIENRNLNSAAFVHYTAQEEKELAHDELDLSSSAYVAPLGINISDFEKVLKDEAFHRKFEFLNNKFVFLFLGRLHYKKGLDLLVKAFSKMVKTYGNIHLLIVGPDEGKYQQKILQWIIEENIENDVTFLGMLSGKEKAEAYAISDVFVLPSYSENFGITVIEAMVSNVPVIISNQVNIAKEVSEAEAGIIIDCDVDQLRDAMGEIYKNEKLRESLRINGFDLVASKYSWSTNVKKIIEMYKEAISM
jgi:glycosyltransferase involved in cell wall biosynthesis